MAPPREHSCSVEGGEKKKFWPRKIWRHRNSRGKMERVVGVGPPHPPSTHGISGFPYSTGRWYCQTGGWQRPRDRRGGGCCRMRRKRGRNAKNMPSRQDMPLKRGACDMSEEHSGGLRTKWNVPAIGGWCGLSPGGGGGLPAVSLAGPRRALAIGPGHRRGAPAGDAAAEHGHEARAHRECGL